MTNKLKRLPKKYDGKMPTSRHIKHLLPLILTGISSKLKDNPAEIISVWQDVVGDKIARLTQVVELGEGVLKIRVDNSTLYSLLVEHEKQRLLKVLQKRLPKLRIKILLFRIG